jgi:PAS domain S-box-containing protein
MSDRTPGRVLVIDDNPDDRALAIRELRKAFPRIETTEITDAQQFASALETGGFDAVLTDFQLGWTTGLEILRLVKSAFPDAPVVMFTATASQEDAVEAMKAGLDDYVVKSPRQYLRLPVALRSAFSRTEAIAARRKAEEQLQRREAWFAATLECIGEGVITADINGLTQSLNPQAERITGWSAADAIGRDIDEVLHLTDTDGQALAISPARTAIAEQRSTTEDGLDFSLSKRDGSLITIMDGASPIYVGNRMEGVVVALRDISERKRLEQQLLQSNEGLQQFAYVASHDLQEPLRTMIVFTQLLARSLHGQLDEQQRQYIDFVEKAGRRMSAQITGLLEFSAQRREAELEVFPVREAVQAASDDLRAYIAERRGIIRCGELGQVRASRSQMSIIFQNLISNGLKYNESSAPTVVIEMRETPTGKVIAVSDNGIGIDPRYREKVFRLFTRLHPNRFEGTGIGLSSVRRAIERLGGHIWIAPDPPPGTTFLINLPSLT